MNLRLEERVFGVGKWFPRLCTCKTVLDKPKQDKYDDISLKTRLINKKYCCPKIAAVRKYISAMKKL
jgi:hypothetical protein